MVKKALLFIILSLPVVNIINAQTKETVKDSAATVVIFNSGIPGNVKIKKPKVAMILKISPLGFIIGRIPLTFEKKISDRFSIQVSAGLTSKNYFRSKWRETLRPLDDDEEDYKSLALPKGVFDVADPRYNYDHRKESIGYMYSIQPRLYLSSIGLHGSFVGLSTDIYRFNYTIPGLSKQGDDLFHTGETRNEYENVRDMMAHCGYQEKFDHFSIEGSAKIGYRTSNGVKYVAGEDLGTGQFYEGENKYTRNDLSFGIGFKVGYNF